MKFKSREVNKQTYNDTSANRISKGAVIEGELIAETDIRVDGKIKGVLQCNAKVVIGKEGGLEGDLRCKEATIEGRVIGQLEVNGLVYIKRTAVIEGDIHYIRLIVDEGAQISGQLFRLGGTTKQLNREVMDAKTETFETSQTA